ncbi:MAG: hypothetical protein HRU70_00825 [Phycisphaeraceae bacterium]|nr:MAG: hypothetical protein HRU70_00825 [Phycisphaeraceae bacterium]
MTIQEFLQHWNLAENPFVGEEARTDKVFGKMIHGPSPSGNTLGPSETLGPLAAFHPDFDRILGDLARPSSAVAFGEKGSGKTAIRMQIAGRVREHNAKHPDARVLFVAFDDLNAFLGHIHARYGLKSPAESLAKVRLVDHLDAVLTSVVTRLTDAVLGVERPASRGEMPIVIGGDPRKTIRQLPESSRRDILLLQALYDKAEDADLRSFTLRRRLGLGVSAMSLLTRFLVIVMPPALIAAYVWLFFLAEPKFHDDERLRLALYTLTGAYGLFVLGFLTASVFSVRQLARRVRKQIASGGRAFASYARSLALVDRRRRALAPTSGADETRYALLDRLRQALARLGYASMLVVVDRVDEPTLVAGDPERMRSVVWPLFNNKLMQQDGVGFKILLPGEMRHLLFKESSSFFQEARLDKQGFVDRLAWTGATLFDLCNARLRACSKAASLGLSGTPSGGPSVMDFFAEDVTRQDLVEALEQMRQPRDAFKFMYRCIAEHCATAAAELAQWRIPKHVVDMVKRQEVDRVQALSRGIRPA